MLSPAILIYCGFIALLVRILLPAIRSPLKHVPGPVLTRFTNLSLRIATIKGRRIHHVHALHKRYGSIVRLSPNEISVSDLNAFSQVHRIGGHFLKSSWYESTHKGRDPGIFAMQDPTQHPQRRRLFARAFSYTSLATHWETTVREKVSLAVKRIKQCATHGDMDVENGKGRMGNFNGADIMKWWTLMATDVVAHLSFGESFHMFELGRQTKYIDAIQETLLGSVLRHEMPLLWRTLCYLPFKKLRTVTEAESIVYEYGEKAVQNMRREGGGAQNLFGQMEAAAEKDDGMITDADIKTEAGNLIVAGSDTTAVTLTYLVWAVLKQPALQSELEEEIDNLSQELELDELMKNAPLLNSVIEETLRLYGAAPGALPRTVPEAGARLAGYRIAAGVEVTTQAFTLHRDPYIWPDPLRFDGRRFMDKSTMSQDQKISMHPFGAGSRVCIGLHLAWMELRLGAAMFFRECKGARLAPCMDDWMMEFDNRFLIAPKGHCCYILL